MSNAMTAFEMLPFGGGMGTELEELERRPQGAARPAPHRPAGPARPAGGSGTAGRGRITFPGSLGPPRGLGSAGSHLQGPRRHRYRPGSAFGIVEPVVSSAPDDSGEPLPAVARGAAPAAEQIRWVQFTLNTALGSNLPTDGRMSPDLRTSLRTFQGQQGLPTSGFVGPDTIAALQRMGAGATGGDSSEASFEFEAKTTIDSATLAWARGIAPTVDAKMGSRPPLPIVNNQVPATLPKEPGLYRITFTFGGSGPNAGKPGMYNGKSSNLYLRVQAHIKEARQLGFNLDGHAVRFLPLPALASDRIRALEYAINEIYRNRPGVTVTNERLELESFGVGPF
jgi:peptidoglycan hydrolase-like protein with peptidoglycan-binding domain